MKSILLSLTMIIFIVLISCSGDKGTDTPKTPQITTINPSSAKVGIFITISGKNFGASQGSSLVSFLGANVTEYWSWHDTEIKVKVPVGATTGKVYITVNGTKSNEVDFIINSDSDIEYGTVTDIDGNTYRTVKICNQWWMAENLKVTKYRNGSLIPQVIDETAWSNLKTEAWCYYKNDPAMGAIYGKLYNWYAINKSIGLAPVGWHVPSDAEWRELVNCLGGDSVAGGKLKSTDRWQSPNTGATNSSGFSALPGGWRYTITGTFDYIGYHGHWWSAADYLGAYSWHSYLNFDNASVSRFLIYMEYGFSVRCVKDN